MKLLIVDDDKIIRTGLKKIILNMDLGFEDYLEAEDGNLAFEICSTQNIAVVVTDIKMENAGGIDFISKFRAINKQTQFIILSGYADFNYAQSAIQNNVVSYLLKPVQKTELNKSLKICISNYMTILSNQAAKARLPELFFKDYALNYNPDINYKSRLKELEFTAKYNFFACICLFKAEAPPIQSDEVNILSRFSVNDYSQYLIINFNREALPQFLDNIVEQIKNKPHSHVAISSLCSIDNLPILLQESTVVSLNRYMFPDKKLFIFDDTITSVTNPIDLSHIYQNLKKALLNKSIDEVICSLESLFNKIQNQKNSSVSFLLECFSDIYYSGIKDFFVCESDYKELYLSSENLDEFYESLISAIDFDKPAEMPSVNHINNMAKSAKLKLALKHIELKFNSLQSIEELSDIMDISPNHLRKLFKNELAISFSQYLLIYRMEKSKKYLKNLKYKIYEISYLIGLNDEKYFYKLFRKQFGITPTQYRNDLKP